MDKYENWQRQFFTIYLGQGFSLLTSSAIQFSIIWWITVTTGSALALTIASIVGLLPQAILGPFAGVLIDRYNRRTIMIMADSAIAFCSLALSTTFVLGTPSLIVVYAVLFLRSLGETFHKTALQASIPRLVPESYLTKANGLGQMVQSACSMAGPMLGAFLMSITSLRFALYVDVLGATLAVLTLSAVTIPKGIEAAPSSATVMQEMRLGIRTIRENKVLMTLCVAILLSTIVFLPLGTLLPLIVRLRFNGSAWHNGLVQTLFSAGMLTAAMVIGITGGFKKQFLMMSLGILAMGVCSVIGGLLPGNAFWLFTVVVFVMGTTGMVSNIPFTTYVQRTVPQQHLGKVIALITSVMSLAAPIGMLIAGPLSQLIGTNNWMILSGAATLIVGALCYVLTRHFENPQGLPTAQGV